MLKRRNGPRTESPMYLSRRSFVKAASVSGIGALTVPLIAARGSEALRDGILELRASPSSLSFASDERAASRLLKSDAIRLDSNENPNGPGKAALDAIHAMFGETPRYPDVPGDELRKSVATHLKIAPENVLVGCGSGEV